MMGFLKRFGWYRWMTWQPKDEDEQLAMHNAHVRKYGGIYLIKTGDPGDPNPFEKFGPL